MRRPFKSFVLGIRRKKMRRIFKNGHPLKIAGRGCFFSMGKTDFKHRKQQPAKDTMAFFYETLSAFQIIASWRKIPEKNMLFHDCVCVCVWLSRRENEVCIHSTFVPRDDLFCCSDNFVFFSDILADNNLGDKENKHL